ncbi:MAG: ferritin family protein [Desulfobacteraceae bacterium]|nr:ferritin family protein [Desulfobacteraceae bacterium]MBC2756325.1 ferritin family protein [Desulfobacteraceae bacterium]
MAFDFNAKDIFEMAKQMERNGAKFYQSAAEGVSSEEEKKFLLHLAKMEEAHEQTFADIEAQLPATETAETTFDPENETAKYIKALVDTKVFFEKDIDTSSMKEILKSAITAEKDSIVFYLGMKDLVPGKLGSTRIDDIIKEEMSHIRILGRELLAYK